MVSRVEKRFAASFRSGYGRAIAVEGTETMARIIPIATDTDKAEAIAASTEVLLRHRPCGDPDRNRLRARCRRHPSGSHHLDLRDEGPSAVQPAHLPHGGSGDGRALRCLRPDLAKAGRGVLAGTTDARSAAQGEFRHSSAGDGRLDTVGIRVPVGFTAELIRSLGRPLAAPSAKTRPGGSVRRRRSMWMPTLARRST